MNRKIIGILVCMLLIATALPVFGFAEKNEQNKSSFTIVEKQSVTTSMGDAVDQQQTTYTGSERIQLLSGGLAQSFQPATSPLTKVAILLTKTSGVPEYANYYIEIRPDINSPTYYRKISIPGSEFTSYTLFWLIYDISDLSVVPGNDYWIVCYADTPTIYSTQVKWCYGSPGYDPYPNGNSMINGTLGWSPYDLLGDFCFVSFKPGGSSNNPPNTPTTPFGPTIGTVGVSYTYTTIATDPDGDDIKYGWDWNGDSIIDEYSSFYSSGETCTMTHTWESPGIYNVKVKAKDEHNAFSGFSPALTVTISVANNPPNKPSTPSGPTSGKAGISYTYSTSAIDSEGDQVYYQWDWGDEVSTWDGPYNSGDAAVASHIWNNDGTFPVKVKAKDASDAESVWSDPLSVSMPKNKGIKNTFFDFLQQYPGIFEFIQRILKF